MNLAVCGTRG